MKNNLLTKLIVINIILLTFGCNEVSTSSGTTESSSTSTTTSSYKSTETLTEEASEEVADSSSCQTEEPDFDAVQEELVKKLTDLVTRLEAMDTAEMSDEELIKHADFIAKVKSDLELVSSATELSDEIKEIIEKVWSKKGEEKERNGHFRHRRDFENHSCQNQVRNNGKSEHCKDLEKLLAVEALSDSLKSALEERYTALCSSTSSDSTSTDDSSSDSSESSE